VNEIKKLCDQQKCPTLPEAKRRVTGAIERELLRRENRFALWAETWRGPNADFLLQQPARDLNDYLAAVAAIAAGL
jgi:hypothetical protein